MELETIVRETLNLPDPLVGLSLDYLISKNIRYPFMYNPKIPITSKLEILDCRQLRDLCRRKGIKRYSKLKKADMIEILKKISKSWDIINFNKYLAYVITRKIKRSDFIYNRLHEITGLTFHKKELYHPREFIKSEPTYIYKTYVYKGIKLLTVNRFYGSCTGKNTAYRSEYTVNLETGSPTKNSPIQEYPGETLINYVLRNNYKQLGLSRRQLSFLLAPARFQIYKV